MRRIWILAVALAVWAGPSHAVLPQEQLADPRLEARARHISSELRCLVCQNQTIDDSDAALAGDLRIILRERLLAGDSDQQAKDFLVARYGSYVLLKPPLDGQTLILWLGPFLSLLVGAAGVAVYLRRRGREDLSARLTASEQDRFNQMLKADDHR